MLPVLQRLGDAYSFQLVCLSVTLLNDGVSVYDFAVKLVEYRNAFDTGG